MVDRPDGDLSPTNDAADDEDGRDPAEPARTPAEPKERRPRHRPTVAEVFGDVLPDTTGDERDEDSDRAAGRSSRDEEILRDVPPHH
jgi:hypothetical protein